MPANGRRDLIRRLKVKIRTVSKPIHSKYFQVSGVYINILNFSKLTMSGFYYRWRVRITHCVYRDSLKLIHSKAAKPENSRWLCQIQQLYTIPINFHPSYILKTWLTSLKFAQPNPFYRNSICISSLPHLRIMCVVPLKVSRGFNARRRAHEIHKC